MLCHHLVLVFYWVVIPKLLADVMEGFTFMFQFDNGERGNEQNFKCVKDISALKREITIRKTFFHTLNSNQIQIICHFFAACLQASLGNQHVY